MKSKVFMVLFLSCFALFHASAQGSAEDTFDIASASIYYPHRLKPKEIIMEIALSQVKLPLNWLQNSIQPPLFHFQANYGLPKGFSLNGRYSSLLVASQVSFGPRWSHQINNFSFNAGYDLAFAFGYLNYFGFDTSVTSWINYPNASVGFRFKDVTLTIKYEYVFVSNFSSLQGDNEVVVETNFSNGSTIAIYMEQRVHKNTVLVVGLKNSLMKFHFMAWPAFSAFNRAFNMPEFYIGVII